MTVTVAEYKDQVAGLGCIVCRRFEQQQKTRTTLHHPRIGQGKSQRASDWLVVPLCAYHHQDPKGGIESGRFYHLYKLDEIDLIAMTIEAVQTGRVR